MIYRNLSIAAGGGIIAHNQQAEQEEGANIFIGLGGTGISCLKEVKAKVYNRLKPDDVNAEIPEYKHIQFLAIDTDSGAVGDDGSVSNLDHSTEFLNIGTNNIHALITNTGILKQNQSMQWFSDDISIQNALAGAGGVRQIGRLLVMQNVDKIVSKIKNKIDAARINLNNKPIHIHIFTGMGGGTGSGTFLDICYIVNHILSQQQLHGQVEVCGYFFLPDVNLDKVKIPAIQRYIEANGFAAMKELDHCMSYHYNHDEWNQNYGSFTVRTKEQPVTLAHLITAKNEDGSIKSNGYNYAMNVVAEYVMEFMTKEDNISDQDRANGDFGMKSHISNVKRIVSALYKKRGACHDYCVLGSANAYIPYKDINTYLAAKIFEKIDEMPKANHDIDSFVKDNGYDYRDIENEILKGAATIPFYEVDARLLKEQCQGITTEVVPQVLVQMRDAMPAIEGAYAKNKDSLLKTLVASIDNKLTQYCTTFDKGPFYAALMLQADKKTDRDMGNIIEGLITENDRKLSDARADLTLRNTTWATTLRNLQNSKFGSVNKHAQAYVAAVNAYFKKQIDIERYVVIGDLLNELKPQITSLYNEKYAPLIEMLNNISETFRKNMETLSEKAKKDTDYAVKIIDFDDDGLKEKLDISVDNLPFDKIITGFIERMLEEDNAKVWQSRSDEAKLSNIISEYFVKQLATITDKNIDDYLAIKYKTDNPKALTDAIYHNIMNDLKNRAKPLFWADQTDGGISEDSKKGSIYIPSVSAIIGSAAGMLQVDNEQIDIKKSKMSDRMSILMFYCGIPMFMFKGSTNYKPGYEKNKDPGTHLYEGNDLDERDFSKVSDIIPFSILLNCNNPSDMIQSFHESYKLARNKKVMDRVAVDKEDKVHKYFLRTVDKEAVDKLVIRIDKLLSEGNIDRAEKFLNEINIDEVEFSESLEIPKIGNMSGFEDSSVEELIYASDILTDKLMAQLEVIAMRTAKINELKKLVEGKVEMSQALESFANAMCTGVIRMTNRFTFAYLKDEDGFTDEYTLTDIDTQPFGESIPLYSAFVKYMALDDEDKEGISRLSKDRKVNDEDICREAATAAKEYIEKNYDVIKESAELQSTEHRKEILKFVENYYKRVNTLARTLI